MSDFKDKIRHIQFPLDLAGGAYSAPPDAIAVFKGPTSKGREGKKDKKGRGEQGKG